MQELIVETKNRNEFLDITELVSEAVKKELVSEGMCLLFVPHTTAGLTINENDCSHVKTDIIDSLEGLVPSDAKYKHKCDRENGAAHIKQSIIGCQLMIPLSEGKLVLGTWQGIMFCELDGPRTRKLFLQTIGK